MQKCEQFHFRHRYNDAKIETIPLDGQGFHGRGPQFVRRPWGSIRWRIYRKI